MNGIMNIWVTSFQQLAVRRQYLGKDVKSPCKKICKLIKGSAGKNSAIGCGRTREEIKLWSRKIIVTN